MNQSQDRQTFLLAMYKEQCDQARQHENLRQQSTVLSLSLMTAIVAVLAIATNTATGAKVGGWGVLLPRLDLALGIVLAALGVFTMLLSLKHYERNRFHSTRAAFYRNGLEHLYPANGAPSSGTPVSYPYASLRDEAADWHSNKWGKGLQALVRKSRLFWYWIAIDVFVILVGVAVIALSSHA